MDTFVKGFSCSLSFWTFSFRLETLALLSVLHLFCFIFDITTCLGRFKSWYLQQHRFSKTVPHTIVLIWQFASARWDACRELFGSFQCVMWTKQLNQWASIWCSLWGLLSNDSYNGQAVEPGSSVLCVMVMLGGCFWAGRECVWNKKVCVL